MERKSYEGYLVGEFEDQIYVKKIYHTIKENIEINIEFIKGENIPYCYLIDMEKNECLWEGEVSPLVFKKILSDVKLFTSKNIDNIEEGEYQIMENSIENKIIDALKEYENKNYDQAFKLFKSIREVSNEEEFNRLYSFKFIKTIYESVIKKITTLDKDSQEWIKYIIKHLKNKDVFYVITVFKVVDLLMKKIDVDYDKIIIWLQKLSPELLSKEVKAYELNGTQVQASSQREKYYAYLSKAYEKKGELGKAKQISLEAIENLTEFTNGSDVWFNRRIAICDSYEGNKQLALSRYREITKKKNDWFILKEIADIYLGMENIEESKKKYLDAILAAGESDKKINLFIEFYDKSKQYGINSKLALDSLKIYFKIKLENNWNITEKDRKIAEINKIILEKENFIKTLEKDFFKECKNLRWSCENLYFGIIDTVSEKFFFIKTENGEKYYCKSKNYPNRKSPTQGIPINFNLVETFDSKKNKFTQMAINLSIVNGAKNVN